VNCAKTAEPIDLPFGLWTRAGRRKHNSIVFARWRQYAHMAIVAIWRIRLNRPSAAAMRSYVKLLRPQLLQHGVHDIRQWKCAIHKTKVPYITYCIGVRGWPSHGHS